MSEHIDAMQNSGFQELTWDVINKYFKHKNHQLVKHQIEGFNDFILRRLDQIISGFNPTEVNHTYIPEANKFKYIISIEVRNPVLNKPTICEKDGSTKIMTPNDARQRNLSYCSNLNIDMHITVKTLNTNNTDYNEETKVINNISLGKIPIMVKSNYCVLKNTGTTIVSDSINSECKHDYGGYFIINGNEKVVISQDRISENRTYVFLNTYKVSTYSHIAEIRSVQENKLGVPKITTIKLNSRTNQFGRNIRVNIHHIKHDIPIFILMKALGLSSDKEIITYIVHDIEKEYYIVNELVACVSEASDIITQYDALEYMAKYLNITGYSKEILNNKAYRINIVRSVLEKEFLPHVGKDYLEKHYISEV